MAVLDDLEPEHKLRLYPHSIDWKNHAPVPHKADAQTVALEWIEPLRAECQHFLDCIGTRTMPRTDGREGLRVLEVLRRCEAALHPSAPVKLPGVHETVAIDEDVTIGEGTTIWHVSHLLRNTRIGKNCRIGQNVVIGPNVTVGDSVKIQNNVSVYEGVTLEDHVFCGPSMVFTNVVNPRSEIRRMHELRPTLVRRGATLGANCTILCGVTIGQYAFVGAGAVVLDDRAAVWTRGRKSCAIGRLDVRVWSSDQIREWRRHVPECRRAYVKLGREVTPHEPSSVVGSASTVRTAA